MGSRDSRVPTKMPLGIASGPCLEVTDMVWQLCDLLKDPDCVLS